MSAVLRVLVVQCALLLSATAFAQLADPRSPESRQAAIAALEGRDVYYDDDGLIVHRAGDAIDGGDTAQREGWYWLGVWLRQNTPGLTPWTLPRKLSFEQVLKLLEPKGDGVFYRHPKLPPWNNPFSKEWGTSRDQLVPLIAAMGVYGKRDELLRLWEALPEDVIGKHAFNGNYRNFLGQDGPNCGDIKKRGCDATADCSLREDRRDCSLKEDRRDCSLQVDTRDCSQPHDERSCHRFFGNDPFCESAKLAQNAAYAAAKGVCEAAKATQNAGYATAKASCETSKTSQNAAYSSEKLACEAGKSGQNALYAAEKASCETAKTTAKYACEVDKQASFQVCRTTNVFSGDLIGPATINLFRRAFDWNPLLPLPYDIANPTLALLTGGPGGETELFVGTQVRVLASKRDKDHVGDDLNHIVTLMLAHLRYPSEVSRVAAVTYYGSREHSYGSYLDAYYAQYGADMNNMTARMDAGIAGGWKPQGPAAYGAVRWYHRPSAGANPMLATLWKPIIERYMVLAGMP